MVKKNKEEVKKEIKKQKEPGIDCRTCVFYAKPNTTGKNEEILTRTDNWTRTYCGDFECEEREYTVLEESKDSVEEGATDEQEEKKDTDNIGLEG